MSIYYDAGIFIREQGTALNLSAADRLVLLTLSLRCGSKTECWPSTETLQADCGLSRCSILRSLKNLSDLNIIKIVKKWRNNRYVIMLHQVSHRDLMSSSSSTSGVTQRLDQVSHRDLINEKKSSKDPVNTGVSEIENFPKNKIRNKKIYISNIDILREVNRKINSVDQKPPNPQKETTMRKKVPKCECPLDYQPTQQHYEFCNKYNIDIELEKIAFVAHFQDSGEKRPGWDRSFTKWLVRAVDYKREREAKRSSNVRQYQKPESNAERCTRLALGVLRNDAGYISNAQNNQAISEIPGYLYNEVDVKVSK